MAHPHFLLHLAIILIISKYVAAVSLKFKMPPVLGMIVAGIIIGPSVLDVVKTDIVIQWLAKLGVILLLFTAGIDTDIIQMKSQGKVSLLTAAGGVLIPFILGFLLHAFSDWMFFFNTYRNCFNGNQRQRYRDDSNRVKKLHSPEGTTILGAAIIDDVIGILMLTFVFGLHGGEGSIIVSILKIAGYFIFSFLIGFFFLNRLFVILKTERGSGSSYNCTCFMFFYAWAAEKAGIAEITGAYIAGLFVGQTRFKRTVNEGIETLGQSFL